MPFLLHCRQFAFLKGVWEPWHHQNEGLLVAWLPFLSSCNLTFIPKSISISCLDIRAGLYKSAHFLASVAVSVLLTQQSPWRWFILQLQVCPDNYSSISVQQMKGQWVKKALITQGWWSQSGAGAGMWEEGAALLSACWLCPLPFLSLLLSPVWQMVLPEVYRKQSANEVLTVEICLGCFREQARNSIGK